MSLEDNIGRALYLYDVYEWPTALTVAVLARPGTTYIDVGARVGSYAALGALAVGPTGRVLASGIPGTDVRPGVPRGCGTPGPTTGACTAGPSPGR